MPATLFDMVRDMALRLDPGDQLALIEALTQKFRADYKPPERKPYPSL